MVKWQEGETMRRQYEQQQLNEAKQTRERMVRQLVEREKVAVFNQSIAEQRASLMQVFHPHAFLIQRMCVISQHGKSCSPNAY